VMGPDCGTAIIAGVPLGFANVVPRGDIGIIGASGTGVQEVSCLIARNGRGISHAIGTGGRDLRQEVGAITTLMAIDALDADEATAHIVLISKPPAEAVARSVLDRVARSEKPFTICFLGSQDLALPANARGAATLKAAAEIAAGSPMASAAKPTLGPVHGKHVRGLFAGGTLCTEAQIVFRDAGLAVTSNVPLPGAAAMTGEGHVMIDLGADEYTLGRPHAIIDPAMRSPHLARALADPSAAVVLLDVVLGYGAHRDPASFIADAVAASPADRPVVVASVCGTVGDPQGYEAQCAKLKAAGILLASSNAAAAERALAIVRRR